MKLFGFLVGIAIFLFGFGYLLAMLFTGVESNFMYVIPCLFIVIGLLFILAVKMEKEDFYK